MGKVVIMVKVATGIGTTPVQFRMKRFFDGLRILPGQLRKGPLGDQNSLAQDGDLVAETLRLVELMGCENDRAAPVPKRFEQLINRVATAHVQTHSRLIQQKENRVVQNRTG